MELDRITFEWVLWCLLLGAFEMLKCSNVTNQTDKVYF